MLHMYDQWWVENAGPKDKKKRLEPLVDWGDEKLAELNHDKKGKSFFMGLSRHEKRKTSADIFGG